MTPRLTRRVTRFLTRLAGGLAAAIIALPLLVLVFYAAEPVEEAWAKARLGMGSGDLAWASLLLAAAGVVTLGAGFGRIAAIGWDASMARRVTRASALTIGVALTLLIAADAGTMWRYSPDSLKRNYDKYPLNAAKGRMMDQRIAVFFLGGCADIIVIAGVLCLSPRARRSRADIVHPSTSSG